MTMYDCIKSMNAKQMKAFLDYVYTNGYEDGSADVYIPSFGDLLLDMNPHEILSNMFTSCDMNN